MNVMHSDSSVIHIETKDGISINMFVETAAILYKKLGFVLTAIGHLERAQNNADLAATDSQQPQLEMPCESDFMAWCAIQHYNQAEAASIYRYIARHIKRVR